MTVQDLMSAPARSCQPETNLVSVIGLMWDHDCGFVPVVDGTGEIVGAITDRDICVAAATCCLLTEQIAAAHIMSQPVYVCRIDDTIEQALAIMKLCRIRRLPVVDGHRRLLGVLSITDLVRNAGEKGAPTSTAVVAALAAIGARRHDINCFGMAPRGERSQP
jgi:CBS domain-containing protein